MVPEQNVGGPPAPDIGIAHENPLSILMHGREMMAHPIFDHELTGIQGSTIVGSLAFGLGCLMLGTYISYNLALKTSGVILDVQTRATYEMLSYGSKYLALFFGAVTFWQYGKLFVQIRRIRRAKGVFTWSDAEGWVRVKSIEGGDSKSGLGRVWERLWQSI